MKLGSRECSRIHLSNGCCAEPFILVRQTKVSKQNYNFRLPAAWFSVIQQHTILLKTHSKTFNPLTHSTHECSFHTQLIFHNKHRSPQSIAISCPVAVNNPQHHKTCWVMMIITPRPTWIGQHVMHTQPGMSIVFARCTAMHFMLPSGSCMWW